MSDEIKQAEETAAPEAAQENRDGDAKAPEKKPGQAPKVKKSWKMTSGAGSAPWVIGFTHASAEIMCISTIMRTRFVENSSQILAIKQ